MSHRRANSNRLCVVDARRLAAAAGTVASFVVAVGVGLMVAPAQGAAFTWGTAASGNWSTATNWSPIGVPQVAGDSATIDAVGAAYTITLNIDPTLDALLMNSTDATLFLNGRTMTVSGASTITAGTVQLRNSAWLGAGTLANSGTMIVEGNSTIANLSNTGLFTLQGVSGLNSVLTVSNPFTNSGTMTFTSQVNASANLSVGGAGTFTNAAAGTVNVLAGASGPRSFNANIANAGAFNVNAAASLDRASGVHTNTGAMSIGAGHSLTVNGNSQRFEQNGGTLAVDGELAVNGATFRFAGGAISGAGLVRITNGRLEMGGGGTGSVVLRGTSSMSGSIVTGQTVLVRGESALNSSITTDGAFSNVGTLTFTSLVNAAANMTVGGSGSMSNFGSLNILAGAGGPRSYNWNLANQGTGSVEIDADASFDGAARTHTTSGQFHIATGRSLLINANSQTFTVTNGTLDVDGLLDVVGATFHFNGGTITGDGTARVTNGRLQLGNGGAGTIVTRGTGTMMGNIKANQIVLVRGESALNTSITADDSFSNAGTLTFTSLINAAANMTVNKGGTLTNNGALNILTGATGPRSYNWNLVNSGTGSVTVDADAQFVGTNRAHSTAGAFSIAGGRSLTINASNQTFSVLGGTLDVGLNGVLDVAGATLALNGGSITGAGTVRTTNGRLSLGPNATAGTVVQRGVGTMSGSIASGLNVLVRGEPSLNTGITADDSFGNAGSLTFTSTIFANSHMTVNGGGVLTNTGTLSILPGAGGSRMYNWNLANAGAGTVSVEAASVFAGNLRNHSNDGTFNVTSGGALTVSGGGQSFSQNAGTLTVNGLFDVEGATFAFNGGSIAGSGTTRVTNGRLTLGALPGGNGTVVHRGSGTMAGSVRSGTTVLVRGEPSLNTLITADDSFSNAGTLTFTSTVFANANMTVNAGGTLTNTGTVNVLPGAGGQRLYNWNLTNDAVGTFNSNTETTFSGTGRTHTNSGDFNVAAGTSLAVNGGGQTFTQAGGTLDVDGVFDANGSTFAFNGGTIGGTGTVRVTNGRLEHGAAGTGAVVHRGSGTMVGNIPSGHRTIIRGEPSLNTSITADDSFSNAGVMDLTSTVFANANLTVNGGRVLTNTGTVNILPGAGGSRIVTAVMQNSGLIVNEAVSSWGASAANHVNDGGTLRLSTSTLTITGATFTNQNEGSVQGNATLDVVGLGATGLANNANLDPGLGFEANDVLSIGLMRLQGNLTQQGLGALRVNIAGTTGGFFDVLNVTGSASLAGIVEVGLAPGYLPSIGDSFRVLNYGSRLGTFAAVNTILGNTGVSFEAQYSGSFMTLVVTAIPTPGTAGVLALAGLTAVRRRR